MKHALRPIDWSCIRRMLIVLPSWVGDATMATPFLALLRRDERLNHTQFVGYMRAGLDELLDGCDLLDDMIVGQPVGLTGPWSEGRRLAQQQLDAAILLPNSWRLAATARLARVPIRVGYARDGRGWMLTHPLSCPVAGGWKQPIPAIDYYLKIGDALGLGTGDRRMRLRASAAQEAAGCTLLAAADVPAGRAVAILNPGASKAEKQWPPDRYAALADYLATEHKLRVLINGSPAERSIVSGICSKATTNPADLVELGVTLGSLKHLASRARLLVSNDTGTRHIAAAAAGDPPPGEPPLGIVSLFGPTDPRWAQIEYPHERQISTRGAAMSEISLEAVRMACRDLLEHAR